MSRRLNWLLSAAFAFGTTAVVIPSTLQAADDEKATAQKPVNDQNVGDKSDKDRGTGSIAERTTGGTQLALPAGAKQSKDLANAANLSGAIVGVTNQALDKNGLDDLVGYFVDQDRNRMKDIDKLNADELNGKIDAITKAWKDKYGDKFDADERDFVANQAVEGEIEDPQQFVTSWPMPVMTGKDEAQQAAARASDNKLDDDTRKNGNIEKGRNVAIVRLPAEAGMPAMDVSLIREAGGWKIDVPNDRTAQQIHDDVQKHVSMIDTAKLPADQVQARRAVARHVLMGIYGLEMPQGQAGSGQAQ